MKTLAIVVPCYNEEETIHPFLEAFLAVERQKGHCRIWADPHDNRSETVRGDLQFGVQKGYSHFETGWSSSSGI